MLKPYGNYMFNRQLTAINGEPKQLTETIVFNGLLHGL